MHCESERVNSFKGWKLNNPCPKELASLGFYQIDTTRAMCNFCKCRITFREGDLGLEKHMERNCKFLLNYPKLKSSNTWCDWEVFLNMSVPENGMNIIWEAARKRIKSLNKDRN